MDVWVASIDDEPGGLARTLRAIADTGASLDCVLARREGTVKGKGVLFVTPLQGKESVEQAGEIGLHQAAHLATLRIEGTDQPGIGAELTRVIGEAGVSLHGLTATVLGHRFVCYASFDSIGDLERAEKAIHTLDAERFPRLREAMRRAMRVKAEIT
jgi:hypothetical protein